MFFAGRICNEGKEQNKKKKRGFDKKAGGFGHEQNDVGKKHTTQDCELLRIPEK